MLFILIGLVIAGGGAAALWYLMPRDGIVHPLATMPVVESLIPIGIVSAFAIGAAMIMAGVIV